VIHDHSYQGYGHEHLIELLDSAKPEHVSGTHAARWRHVGEALDAVCQALNDTIIQGRWSGPTAREFQDRLAAAATAAGHASLTAHNLGSGLECLAGDIETARREMPPVPAATPLAPDTAGANGVIAQSAGYEQSLARRQQTRIEAQQVMTRLGGSMQTDAEYWWPAPGGSASVSAVPAGPAGAAAPALRTSNASATMPTGHATVRHGADQPRTVHLSGTHRTAGTELAGLGGPVAAGGGTAPGLPSATVAMPTGASNGAAVPSFGPLPPGAPTGTVLAEATGRPAPTRLTPVPEEPEPLYRTTTGLIGGTSTTRRDEPEEYTTWRTEDDLLWQDPNPGPPPLIE
jgi:hypothetical protein